MHYHDPLVPDCTLPDGTRLSGETDPQGADWDLVLIHTVHPGVDYGWAAECPRVLLVGASYKAGVRDLRESPALAILSELVESGVDVGYHDPLLDEIELPSGKRLRSEPDPDGLDWDLVLVHTVHPGHEHEWVRRCPRVLDATYQFDSAEHRELV